MKVPDNMLYTEEHEWVLVADDVATIGITEYAQNELGDVVFVEMPKVGDQTQQMQACGSIEAVKAVSDLFAPVSGEVTEINAELESNPQLINEDAFGNGWILKVKLSDPEETEKLLSADQYRALIGQ